MIKVKDVFDYLNSLYPVSDACDFDNVGLLVGSGGDEVKSAVVTLDCDITAIEFANRTGANLIITHHPVIFEPLKSVTADGTVYRLIKDGISVISMHTNLDVSVGGVNDTLCKALNLTDVKPYTAADGYRLKCGNTNIEDADSFASFIKERLGGAVKYVSGRKPVKSVLVCSGSGGGYISEAISGGFDALVTADIKHNHFIAAINSGISLFDGGHFDTENIIVNPLCERLKKEFSDLEFIQYNPDTIKLL